MKTFILVHGAWAGSWAMQGVADRLAAMGHRVITPALTGLGERSHLAGPKVNLATHVRDVVNEIDFKDLESVVLVGHSYAGLVITGVAEKRLKKLAAIVYVDAFIPKNNQSFASMIGMTIKGAMVAAPKSADDEYPTPAIAAWVNRKTTKQPAKTLTQKLAVKGAYQRVPKKLFLYATGWEGFEKVAMKLKKTKGWMVEPIACGHDVPILKPDALAQRLDAL